MRLKVLRDAGKRMTVTMRTPSTVNFVALSRGARELEWPPPGDLFGAYMLRRLLRWLWAGRWADWSAPNHEHIVLVFCPTRHLMGRTARTSYRHRLWKSDAEGGPHPPRPCCSR